MLPSHDFVVQTDSTNTWYSNHENYSFWDSSVYFDVSRIRNSNYKSWNCVARRIKTLFHQHQTPLGNSFENNDERTTTQRKRNLNSKDEKKKNRLRCRCHTKSFRHLLQCSAQRAREHRRQSHSFDREDESLGEASLRQHCELTVFLSHVAKICIALFFFSFTNAHCARKRV